MSAEKDGRTHAGAASSTASTASAESAESAAEGSLIGKIKRVDCTNFVTFDVCSFQPSPYLNIICGPNGTGKSSLVAAIVLGLGGEPKLLSRAISIGDYIKNGRSEASISVEIYKDAAGRTQTFTRSFDISERSEYKVGGAVVKHAVYLRAIAAYKIQIGNLCQFLPQDRVQEFAKMNAQEILENTVISVCSDEVIQSFAALKELRARQVETASANAGTVKKLEDSKAQLNALKEALQYYDTRRDYQRQLDVCVIKRLWLEIADEATKAKKCRDDERDVQAQLDKYRTQEAALRASHAEFTKAGWRLKQEAKEKDEQIQKLIADKDKIIDQIRSLKAHTEQLHARYQRDKAGWETTQKERQNKETMVELTKQELENARAEFDAADIADRVQQFQQQMLELKGMLDVKLRERLAITQKLDQEYSLQVRMLRERIARAEDVAEQKLQRIRELDRDVYTAVRWLRDNASRFSGKVYNPILMEVNVPDPSHVKYFENIISKRDLLAFTCEHKADMSLLVEELCIRQKLNITACCAPDTDERYTPSIPIEHLRKYGFVAYLIDLIEGPRPVLNYLCKLRGLHNIPIGGDMVARRTDDIPASVSRFYGGDQFFFVSVSKYSHEKSVVRNAIQEKKLLTTKDVKEIEMLKAKLKSLIKDTDALKNSCSRIEAEINEIEVKRRVVIREKREFDHKLEEVKHLERKLHLQEQQLRDLMKSVSSEGLAGLEKQFVKDVNGTLDKIMALQRRKVEVLRALLTAQFHAQLATAKVNAYENNSQIMDELKKISDKVRQLENLITSIRSKLNAQKALCERKQAEALQMTGNVKPTSARYPHKDMYDNLPDDLDELKDKISEYSARLECMSAVDQNVVNEQQAKAAEVEALMAKITDSVAEERRIIAQIEAVYSEFYPKLSACIERINGYFSDFMTSMGYVGEVNLCRKSDHDFNSYGIEILVQYRRSEPLQTLDRFVLSGGERAVAIAVYTLSLQKISFVPFRCVDEINQGMDAKNERLIFEMLVDETTQPNRAQFFFVTPKLLSHLPYNDLVNVHLVFNGKYLTSSAMFV